MADPWRVAQIAVERGSAHNSSRGSGYLIGPGRVLTAAHVVAGASLVWVRLDVGQDAQIEVQAVSWWADPAGHEGTDLAVITIAETATAGRPFERASFGRISDCDAVLSLAAFGFPLFKLRENHAAGGRGVFRDLEQVAAHASVASNRRQRTLAVTLDDPPPSPPSEGGGPSPWEGMSGAAVWAAGKIVGVVAEHYASEGTGRLTARRIDRAYEQLPGPDLGVLAELLGLPAAAGGLPDVVPVERGQLVRLAYLVQVQDIAPDELVGREAELAGWTEFCAGSDPYGWWQAAPWAGKTALASWFVTHPPPGVDVVSFFITGRLSGQADSDAFLDAMIEQLQALDPAGTGSAAAAGARAGTWLNLLASTAARAAERARRLVVVVDGLDEDDAGATPSRGRPSIAKLLPRRPPPGARFIITSRPDPGLPDDLPPAHPLRDCTPHRLRMSWLAQDLEMRARQELRDLLGGNQMAIDVVGFIAGSGGGLTISDLSDLTGEPVYKLEPLLRGVSGRSLQTRASTDARDPAVSPATRVYLFAHETLGISAEAKLGRELDRYRQKVHEWIDSYARAGWPGTAPGYAIRGYPRLLAATADTTRVSALARDPRRHAFLLHATRSDYAAITEIRAAQGLIADQSELDLQALVELAAYRHAISIRNQSISADLIIVWARLARFDHAEALARTISDPGTRARVLAGVVTAAAQARDLDHAHWLAAAAEDLARAIPNPGSRARALTELASAWAQAGDLHHAEALARTIPKPDDQARALTELVTAAVQAGDLDYAHRLAADADAVARTIPGPDDRAGVLAGLVSAWASAGDLHHAEALARTIPNPGTQARVLTELVTAAVQAGDLDHAHRLAAGAEALARTIPESGTRAHALARLVTAAAQAGDLDHAHRLADDAEAVARTIPNLDTRSHALTELAAAAQACDLDQARRLAADADALVSTLTSPYYDQAWTLGFLVNTAAEAGDLHHAEALARTIPDADDRAWNLAGLATAAAKAGDRDYARQLAADAEALARTIPGPDERAGVLAGLVTAAACAGDLHHAETLARTIPKTGTRARALTELAAAAAQAGDLDYAHRLADDAEALSRTIPSSHDRPRALIGLATAAAQAGDLHHAEALACTISHVERAEVLTMLPIAAAQAGDLDRAETLARTLIDPDERTWVLTRLATAAAQAGDLDYAHRLAADAEALARNLTDTDERTWVLAELAIAAAQAGDLDYARLLAADAEALAPFLPGPFDQARALTRLITAAAQAGDLDYARRLAADVEALAPGIHRTAAEANALTDLVAAAVQVGDLDYARRLAADAEALACTLNDPAAQAEALTRLATAAAQAGDLDHAHRLAADAEALACTLTDPSDQARALTELATVTAQAGDLDHARRVLARALIVDLPGIWWADPVSRLFPSVIRNAWNVLVSAYTTQALWACSALADRFLKLIMPLAGRRCGGLTRIRRG